VLDDKLVGFVDRVYREMPVTDVKVVSAKRMAVARTTALVAAGVVGIAATIAIVSGSGQADDPCVFGAPGCPTLP
jgi:hypothetical protein